MAKSPKLEITPLNEWGMFHLPPRPCVIAGPCSAETEEQVMTTAAQLKEIGINVYRAGIWKPRTHPGSFEGVGTQGLKWMQRAKRELGLKIATEVANEKHVFDCLKYGVDLVWIGARTTANPFLVQEIAEALADTDIPVLVKNPVSPDIDLWIGALERLNRAGIRKIGVIHRGFSTSEKIKYRNDPLWQYVEGLMVESHCNPSVALSDANQQLTPAALADMLENQLVVRDADTADSAYKETISQLRAKIDVIDENLIHTLAQRMEISRRIGESKRENKIAILQTGRWEAVLADVVAKGKAQE